MIDRTKRYRTPSGEVVTGAELVEVPPVRTAEDIVEDVYARWRRGDGERRSLAECAVTALREAGKLKEPEYDGWIEHDGGPCPVDDDVRVQVRLANGETRQACRAPQVFVWRKDAVVGSTYITHYRVVGE